MSEHHILVLCFTICFIFFSNGQLASLNNGFPSNDDPSMKNLKLNLFSNPFGEKDVEKNRGAVPMIPDTKTPVERPDSGIGPQTADQNGVRRKFGSRQSWRSKYTKTRQISPLVSNQNPIVQPRLVSNGIANPYLKQKPVTQTMEEKPKPYVQPPPQNHYVTPIPVVQDIDHTGGGIPVVPTIPATTNNEDAIAEEYEFGGESFLVPCQWA